MPPVGLGLVIPNPQSKNAAKTADATADLKKKEIAALNTFVHNYFPEAPQYDENSFQINPDKPTQFLPIELKNSTTTLKLTRYDKNGSLQELSALVYQPSLLDNQIQSTYFSTAAPINYKTQYTLEDGLVQVTSQLNPKVCEPLYANGTDAQQMKCFQKNSRGKMIDHVINLKNGSLKTDIY